MTSFSLNYLLRALSPNRVVLNVRELTYELEGDIIQSRAPPYHCATHYASCVYVIFEPKLKLQNASCIMVINLEPESSISKISDEFNFLDNLLFCFPRTQRYLTLP